MENSTKQIDGARPEDVFDGGGEMGELMRSIDWSQTPLGPVSQWPQSVRLPVKICLTSRFPMILWWGPGLIMHYNDAWYPSLGTVKHPRAMGHSGQECYPEIWDTIGPMLHSVLDTGKATWSDNQMFFMERNGYKEECYFTFSYSPIRDEQGMVSGVFTAVAETTEQMLGQRRLNTLRDLGAHYSQGKTAEEACQIACQILEDNQADLPFGLIYLLSKDGKEANLSGTVGLLSDQSFGSPQLDLKEAATNGIDWPLDQVIAQGQTQLITNLGSQLGEFKILGESVVPKWALILPLRSPGEDRPTGFMVAGLSPFRELNESYHSFVELVADNIATSIANARAYEAERKRAEALAELDRAKTAFFSNISHEFRTPLTLILGPLEDAMENITKDSPTILYERLEMIQRNGLRLLKLVNSLLDFSRIEAGRVEAVYKPTDLSTLTAELGSVFRAAIERAGLNYIVDCPPLDLAQSVYLDQEMWEKIVFNLLSNAYKFTFEGWIGLRLRGYEDHIELEVRDSGTGISAEQLPHLFERFHRVQEAKARTHEGSGIGLALVQELVKLHGGLVQVESMPGQGTTFRVILPIGKAHLPSDRVEAQTTLASSRSLGKAYIEEALGWLPEEESKLSSGKDKFPAPIESETDRLGSSPRPASASTTSALPGQENLISKAYILLADDNADMRHYVRRLLSEQGYRVEVAENGLKALEEARLEVPDLVLSDVMMPEMDGFELLAALRNDPATSRLPVILLSARAGEEAVIEGVKVGADDYLIKPFSARELLARVENHLKLTRMRQQVAEAQQSLTMALEAAQLGSWDLDLVSNTATYSPRYAQIFGYRELPAEWGHHLLREHVLSEDQAIVDESFKKALDDGSGQFRVEARIRWPDGTIHWIYYIGRVFYNPQRQPVRMAGMIMDLTERKQKEEQARFLLDYGEKLRPLNEEEVVFEQSARLLGEYLKVERCYFAEMNFETPQLTHHANYCKNKMVQSLAGIYKLANSQWAEELQSMGPVMITDTTTDKIPSQFYAQLYQKSNPRSILIVPLHDGKKAKPLLTVITEYTIQPHKWQEEEISLVKLVLERVWLAVQNARLYRRAQLTAVLEERNRIARTLHDSLQQDFYIIQLQANTVLSILERKSKAQLVDRIGAHLNEILLQAEGGIAGLRTLIFDLHTEAVAREGLVAGLLTYLESLKTKYRLKVISYLGAEPRLKIEIKEALYWIAREALQNIIRHAHASEVELTLSQPNSEPGVIELTIKDNGRGFDLQNVELGHLGLSTMRERAENCEGKVSVTSKIGRGTLVVATFRVRL